jgi:uroporphyrin-III C-methyltransferase
MTGKVSLVGAGPGDPELLTLKAMKAIELADAVVYDRLVSDAVLAMVPRGIPRFFAGKSCKEKAMTQEEINHLLITLADRGSHVVRLKGGDPFLFGRGGEEAFALARHGVPFEIIPGITSAQGCAAYAGIPLTHRELASSVRFITGHRVTAEEAEEPLELDWQGLADPDSTLVVYMGLANLATITEKLIAHGLSADTPAAAISQGTTQAQQVVLSALRNIAVDVAASELEAPTLVIIGKVAGLARTLAWFSPREVENTEYFQQHVTKINY